MSGKSSPEAIIPILWFLKTKKSKEPILWIKPKSWLAKCDFRNSLDSLLRGNDKIVEMTIFQQDNSGRSSRSKWHFKTPLLSPKYFWRFGIKFASVWTLLAMWVVANAKFEKILRETAGWEFGACFCVTFARTKVTKKIMVLFPVISTKRSAWRDLYSQKLLEKKISPFVSLGRKILRERIFM